MLHARALKSITGWQNIDRVLGRAEKRMASGQLSSPCEHARCDPWCIKHKHGQYLGKYNVFGSFYIWLDTA